MVITIIDRINLLKMKILYFLDFTWHCSTAAAGLVTLDFIFNTAFYTVKWVFSPQLHFPHSSIFLTAEGNRTCKFDQILWPMLSSTKISCLTGVLNPGLLSVKPRLYHWAKLPLLKVRGKTVIYILQKYQKQILNWGYLHYWCDPQGPLGARPYRFEQK